MTPIDYQFVCTLPTASHTHQANPDYSSIWKIRILGFEGKMNLPNTVIVSGQTIITRDATSDLFNLPE